MSIHIGAQPGEIAETVLLPGDPLRAKYVAENLLEDAQCYNEVRGMYGYTGTYKGKKVSIQGSGMGIPSISIYAHELIHEYQVKTLIRVGTCGCLQEEMELGSVLLAIGASSDSNTNNMVFNGLQYSPTADFTLLDKAYHTAEGMGMKVVVGNVLSTDLFYMDDPQRYHVWIDHNIVGIDMESSALYTLAARSNVQALSILTVSDNIITGQVSSSQDRQEKFMDMIKLALEI
ncbi:MAG: purine-nucleoside phosphorylase [Cyclobacteriaceae bacterium]|nr:purine-nucleoside phosphorylase [Cyclobacteriaceae bacterium]